MRVAVGDLGDRNPAIHRRLQVDMVGANAGRDRKLELRRLGDALGRHIGRPERLRNDDLGVGKLALEARNSAPSLSEVTTRVWPSDFEKFPQTQLAGHAAEQCAGLEIDRLRRRQRLATRIMVDFRKIVARIRLRISVDRIVIENTEDLGHVGNSSDGFVTRRGKNSRLCADRLRQTTRPPGR